MIEDNYIYEGSFVNGNKEGKGKFTRVDGITFGDAYASEEEMKGALAAEGVNLVLIPFEGNTQTVEKLLGEYERIETPSGYAYLLAN